MKRYMKNAVIYCVLGILLAIIGVIWININEKTYMTGVSMLSCSVCFELVAIYFYIRHKRGDE